MISLPAIIHEKAITRDGKTEGTCYATPLDTFMISLALLHQICVSNAFESSTDSNNVGK
jgi:hypothetical protein